MATAPDRRPDAIDTTVQKTYRWLHELADELGGASRDEAYDVLRGYLHTLRDRLTINQAAHLGAQLPMLVRGIYYEGWNPSKVPHKMKADEFLDSFVRQATGHATHWSAEQALRATTRVLLRHVTAGEVLDVLNSLPRDVRGLLL